jgi:hypothetical protein
MDDCVTAINNYLKDNDRLEKEYQAARDAVVKENKRITDKNAEDLKAYSARRAEYAKATSDFQLQDHANWANCGTVPDSSKWVYVWRRRSDGDFSNYICYYRRTDAEVNRLMSVWDDENKFVPLAIQPIPVKTRNTLNINCCTNRIDLSDSDQAKMELKNVKQKCDQNLSNGDGDSVNKDPDSEVIVTPETDTTNDENEKENKNKLKIIIIIIIFIIFISGMGLAAYFILKKK